MSNRKNHRSNESRRTENGPRFENPNPSKGCNSTHVARSRASWGRINTRTQRRAANEELRLETSL